MRTSSGHQSQIITRLENYNADLNRQIALISAQEKVAKETLRTADARTKALKEEMSRLKSTVAQIRSQCANDIRRRDGEIKKLKKHLVGRRGREGTGSPVGVVVVTTAVNKIQSTTRQVQNEVDLKSPEYSLTQETTEFLTQLSQGLSDENDALISLVRNTLETLRNLQGLPVGPERGETTGTCDLAIAAPPSYEELAITMDEVLEHLRGLLTNPAFVPLEEVEVREDEIIRLRQGWEKMEARWQEAVSLMDGWRQRMVSTGDTINLDDLQLGMELASSKDPAALPSHESLIPKQENIDIANSSDLDRAQDASNDPSEVNLIEDLSIDELDTPITTAPSPTKMSPRILSPRSPNVQPPSIRKPSFPSPCNAFFSPIPEEDISPLKSPDEISIPWFSPVKKPSCFPKKVRNPLSSHLLRLANTSEFY